MDEYMIVDRESLHLWLEFADSPAKAIRQADSSRRLAKDRNCARMYSVAKLNDLDVYRVKTDVRKV